MKLERKKRKLLLEKTTLRLLAPGQLTAVVGGADFGAPQDGDAEVDSTRCGVDDITISQQHC